MDLMEIMLQLSVDLHLKLEKAILLGKKKLELMDAVDTYIPSPEREMTNHS
jgi:translation elongation factor EF-Tu-like GTPase